MPRIKKRGLDYFPLNTDFIYNRLVRRIMKREGDAALSVLIEVLSYIYSGEGYYVRADNLFYEDLSSNLYEKSSEDVKRIVALAVEYGVFDTGLFSRYGILTSAEIQQQYCFSTKRRKNLCLEPDYSLISCDQELSLSQSENNVNKFVGDLCANTDEKQPLEEVNGNAEEVENVTFIHANVTSGIHSIAQNSTAQHSVAQQSKEQPHFNSPLETAGEKAEGKKIGKEEISSGSSCGRDAPCSGKRKKWTQETIDGLLPPADGTSRNYAGLLDNLRSYGIPPSEQYAIILKSNFGAIGGAIWQGIATLRGSGGKIKLPGRYLLSVVSRKEEAAVS